MDTAAAAVSQCRLCLRPASRDVQARLAPTAAAAAAPVPDRPCPCPCPSPLWLVYVAVQEGQVRHVAAGRVLIKGGTRGGARLPGTAAVGQCRKQVWAAWQNAVACEPLVVSPRILLPDLSPLPDCLAATWYTHAPFPLHPATPSPPSFLPPACTAGTRTGERRRRWTRGQRQRGRAVGARRAMRGAGRVSRQAGRQGGTQGRWHAAGEGGDAGKLQVPAAGAAEAHSGGAPALPQRCS